MTQVQHLLDRLDDVFRPSAPIDRSDLFRGRVRQLIEVGELMNTRGQHGVIYGERGVGKTSIATVAGEVFNEGNLTIRIACDAADTFTTIWDKLIDELRYASIAEDKIEDSEVEKAAELILGVDTSPQSVKLGLRFLSRTRPVVVFIDEFDRVPSQSTHSLFADTIKALSDDIVAATLIIVGVADDVDSLMSEHESVDRAIVQVRMPRMSTDEIAQIIDEGLDELGLSVSDPEVHRMLVTLPQGLPEYAHRLTQAAARSAIIRESAEINDADFGAALAETLERSEQSMTNRYHKATSSSRPSLYERVLLACAMASIDDLGYFAPADVRAPMSTIMDEPFDIDRFQSHLYDFCTDRGPVLERRGGARRWRYRFRHPMMRPFVLMKGVRDGVITAMDLPEIRIH